MSGVVESMKVQIGSDSNDTTDSSAYLAVTECRLTVRSREMSGSREKETLFGTNRDES